MTLVFNQNNDNRGTCDCLFNGKLIDRCDMNKVRAFTQAHIVVAKLIRTLGHGDFSIKINPCPETIATVDTYSIGDIVEMASYIKDMSASVYELS